MDNKQLEHHGVLGMKWGVRRYQNKDGSLTPAGAKRRTLGQTINDHKVAKKRKANLEKARAAKVAKAERMEKVKAGKISSKKMTNEELNARIERLRLEKTYNDLLRDNNSATFSRGRKFVNKFLDSTVDKVAENAAADVVAQAVKVVTVRGVNKAFGEEVTFANNKKKS